MTRASPARTPILRTLLALALGALMALTLGAAGPRAGAGLLQVRDGAVVIPGTLHPERYRRHPRRYRGHHAVTWEGGGMAGKALITTPVPDEAVAAALARLGLDSRGGIPEQAWSQRLDPEASEPDLHATGSRLEVSVRWGEGAWVPLEELLEDHGGPAALDLRFQDNRRWIRLYGSGCVVCLASCPGAKVGHAGYSMRQNETGPMDFSPRPERLPADGTPVAVRFAPAEA